MSASGWPVSSTTRTSTALQSCASTQKAMLFGNDIELGVLHFRCSIRWSHQAGLGVVPCFSLTDCLQNSDVAHLGEAFDDAIQQVVDRVVADCSNADPFARGYECESISQR